MTAGLPLLDRFSSCSFTPVTKAVVSFSPVVASTEGTWSATSYYLDSSGRSSFLLPLQLGCRTKEDLDCIIASKCLKPAPKIVEQQQHDDQSLHDFLFRLEAQCHPVEKGAPAVTVEGITILSITVEGNSILLDTEVIVRAPFKSESKTSKNPKPKSIESHPGVLNTRLELTAVLADRKEQQIPVASGLVALELGGGSRPFSGNMFGIHSQQTRLGPLSIDLSLTHALKLSSRSVGGPSHGITIVSLTMKHSNTHSEPVTITNIALHPGHSRHDALFLKDRSMPGGERSVVDMSKNVKWGYAPQTEPHLPLVLQPHEAYSVILHVDATDNVQRRSLASPISVTAVVGDEIESSSRRPHAVVATDAQWTTGRVAVEPADAFRIELNLRESTCYVGAPFSLSVKVLNLSETTKDLLLVVPKADTGAKTERKESTNPPAVSQASGYTFGVWGLSGDENSSPGANIKDQDLLAVEAAVVLGEIKGQHSVDSEIRFVPLRDGSLDVPDFKIYDKTEGKWYSCAHKLCVVASVQNPD